MNSLKSGFCAILAVAAVFASPAAKATPVPVPEDVVFLIDASGSLGTTGFQQEQTLVNDFISTWGNDPAHPTRFGAIRFATDATTIYSLNDTQDPAQVSSAIQSMAYTGGYTDTYRAIVDGLAMYDSYSASANPKAMVLITDGVPLVPTSNPDYANNQPASICSLSTEIGSRGINMQIVGSGTGFNPDLISCLVNDPSTDVTPLSDVSVSSVSYMGLGYVQNTVASVPEPATLAIMGAGLAVFGWRRRRAARV